MKKIGLLLIALMLVGCAKTQENGLKVSILSVTGAPCAAFYKYANDPKFETNSNAAQGVLPAMVNNKKDVIILPTNAGIQAIVNKNCDYKIAATITFGNLFIAATGHDQNNTMDPGDYIICFQEKGIPDLLFHYIYGNDYDENIHYVAEANEAAKCLKVGKDIAADNEDADYIVIAQPALQNILNSSSNASIYQDLKVKYSEKSNGLEFFQASVFISNKTDKNAAESFLNQLEFDINEGLNNPDLIQQGLDSSENISTQYGFPSGQLIKQVIENNNGLGLGYKRAKENKNAIDNFLSLFGMEETNEEIYF